MIDCLEEFVNKKYHEKLFKTLREGKKSLRVDFEDLKAFDTECADQFLTNPDESIELFQDAIRRLDLPTKQKVFIRFYNIPNSCFFRTPSDLRSEHIGQMVVLNGLIRQVSEVRPEVVEVTYECIECGAQLAVLQSGFTMKRPAKCACQKSFFKELDKKFVDVQHIKLEEDLEHIRESGRLSSIDIFLRDDLVESRFQTKLAPGTYLKVSGVLKQRPMSSRQGKSSRQYDIFIEANNIESTVSDFEKMELTPDDIKEIIAFSKTPNLTEVFVKSICPSIFGHEEIKHAIALQLFSGLEKTRKDGLRTGGDIHILLVGDPGTGKSQLIQYMRTVAPKSAYISEAGAATELPIARVLKDKFHVGWALEGGPLVLAKGGLTVIDGINAMKTNDKIALQDLMKQQTVSVSKGNLRWEFNVQTAVLATARPKCARFDTRTYNIKDQIPLKPELLSGFDLVFAIKDCHDVDKDYNMAEHMLKLHQDPYSRNIECASTEFIRKYVAYARKNCSPQLGREAMDEIKRFFVDLRTNNAGGEQVVVPLSPSKLNALVRLSEASARMRLARTVTKEDAINGIDIFRSCLNQIGV